MYKNKNKNSFKIETPTLPLVEEVINNIDWYVLNKPIEEIKSEIKELKKQEKNILKEYHYVDNDKKIRYSCDTIYMFSHEYYLTKNGDHIYFHDTGNDFRTKMEYFLKKKGETTLSEFSMFNFSFDNIDKFFLSNGYDMSLGGFLPCTEYSFVYNEEKHKELIKIRYKISELEDYMKKLKHKTNRENFILAFKENGYKFNYNGHNKMYTIYNDTKTFYYYNTTGKWRAKGSDKYYNSKNINHFFELINQYDF